MQINERNFRVYKHTCTVTNKSYIGFTYKSMEQRWHEHCVLAQKGSKYNIHRAIRKHGIENWTHEILEILIDEFFAKASEIYWIEKYDTLQRGYNSTSGGEGLSNPDAETLEKIKEKNQNKTNTPEAIQKITLTVNELWKIPEFRKKHAQATKDAFTPEVRNKIRVANKNRPLELQQAIGKRCAKKVNQYKNNTFIKQHNSIHEASISTNTNGNSISKCCRKDKRYPRAGGFVWIFADEDLNKY
jgi:group I intron endonuclease